jgi:hypothetical protein
LAAKHFGGKAFWRQSILAAKNFGGHFGGKTFWRQKNKNIFEVKTLAQASVGKLTTADTDPQ